MKPDEKSSAESAELRKATGNEAQGKQRRGVAAGGQVGEKCGKGAERIRKLSVSTPSALPAAPKTPRRARSLEQPPVKSRAKSAPQMPCPPGGELLTTTNDRSTWPAHERAVIEAALAIVRVRMREGGSGMSSPDAARELAVLHMAGLERERFSVMFLNAQNQLIAIEDMFDGTLSQTSVYPREVVKAALRHNAGAVILMHNHPSGCCEPSRADEYLTTTLRSALSLVDVQVLDHLVVGRDRATSFAERGLLRY